MPATTPSQMLVYIEAFNALMKAGANPAKLELYLIPYPDWIVN